jgi:hypothetical protein|tara:strand:- start:1136 stop:1309 length:174 start_codon:yes stop_codon:yes gene_type:complete
MNKAIETASDLAELINQDHETELNYLDILDYLAILGVALTENGHASEIYLAALEASA